MFGSPGGIHPEASAADIDGTDRPGTAASIVPETDAESGGEDTDKTEPASELRTDFVETWLWKSTSLG